MAAVNLRSRKKATRSCPDYDIKFVETCWLYQFCGVMLIVHNSDTEVLFLVGQTCEWVAAVFGKAVARPKSLGCRSGNVLASNTHM